jgi:hypothetical protein
MAAIDAAVLEESADAFRVIVERIAEALQQKQPDAFFDWTCLLHSGDSSLPVPIPHLLLVGYRDYRPGQSTISFRRCESCFVAWPVAFESAVSVCPACGSGQIVIYCCLERPADGDGSTATPEYDQEQ